LRGDEIATARRMRPSPTGVGAHIPFAKQGGMVTKPKNMSTWLT
jgi:hypothetical protein